MPEKPMKDTVTYLPIPIPDNNELLEIAEGVYWLRCSMPFKLDHINLWLIEESDSWVVIDTGVNLKSTKHMWQQVVKSHLKGKPITKVICTHMHPDHLGLVEWLCQEHDAQLYMTQGEFQAYQTILQKISSKNYELDFEFFERGGVSQQEIKNYDKFINIYKSYITPINRPYQRLKANDSLLLGDNEWQVFIGRGHSPEHICLWCPSLNIFISGDQLLPTISPNISVHSDFPEADPLTQWIDSNQAMLRLLKQDTWILPAHGKPFIGGNYRIEQQLDEIESDLAKLLSFCQYPCCVIDAFPVLFKKKINDSNLFMAFGEAQAHFNCLLVRGLINKVPDDETLVNYQAY